MKTDTKHTLFQSVKRVVDRSLDFWFASMEKSPHSLCLRGQRQQKWHAQRHNHGWQRPENLVQPKKMDELTPLPPFPKLQNSKQSVVPALSHSISRHTPALLTLTIFSPFAPLIQMRCNSLAQQISGAHSFVARVCKRTSQLKSEYSVRVLRERGRQLVVEALRRG